MDGCIGVFEVVKFHTKRHRATKSWTTIDTENFAVVVTTNLAQMQISVDILLPQTVGQSFTELSHTPHILSDVTVCITKTELLGV